MKNDKRKVGMATLLAYNSVSFQNKENDLIFNLSLSSRQSVHCQQSLCEADSAQSQTSASPHSVCWLLQHFLVGTSCLFRESALHLEKQQLHSKPLQMQMGSVGTQLAWPLVDDY